MQSLFPLKYNVLCSSYYGFSDNKEDTATEYEKVLYQVSKITKIQQIGAGTYSLLC